MQSDIILVDTSNTFDRLLGLLVGLDEAAGLLVLLTSKELEHFADQTDKFKKRWESSTFNSNDSAKIGSYNKLRLLVLIF